MHFNAPRLQQRVHIKKKILGGACPQTPLSHSRLCRSIGKFQFLWAKSNPMHGIMGCIAGSVKVYIGVLWGDGRVLGCIAGVVLKHWRTLG